MRNQTHVLVNVQHPFKKFIYLLNIGCGKTMIAQATAGEAQARFINLDVSLLTDKW